MMQDLIQRQFGVEDHPHYSCTLLSNLGFSYQKAHFVSNHIAEAKRLEWRQHTWPSVLRRARQRKAAALRRWGQLDPMGLVELDPDAQGTPTQSPHQWYPQGL